MVSVVHLPCHEPRRYDAQGVECLLNGAAGERRSILVRKKEGILTFRKVAAPAEGYMGIQHLGKLWSNRDQTAFIELRAAYGQNSFRQIDIRQRETSPR